MKSNTMDSLALFYEACAHVSLFSTVYVTVKLFSWKLTIIVIIQKL